jgi:hypothetical protein
MAVLTDEELIDIFTHQLPRILEERPELEPSLYRALLKTFAQKEEIAAVHQELFEFREETRTNFDRVDQRFEQVDQRFNSLEQRVQEGFTTLSQQIERLGARWGIQTESLFRETMIDILQKDFGANVQSRYLKGEQFDVVITNGHHILVEISAGASPNIVKRLERKRKIYIEETGVEPERFIFAVTNINSRRAQALREAGFEVIEPED